MLICLDYIISCFFQSLQKSVTKPRSKISIGVEFLNPALSRNKAGFFDDNPGLLLSQQNLTDFSRIALDTFSLHKLNH